MLDGVPLPPCNNHLHAAATASGAPARRKAPVCHPPSNAHRPGYSRLAVIEKDDGGAFSFGIAKVKAGDTPITQGQRLLHRVLPRARL